MTTPPNRDRRRLLVVDDDPVAREFATLALSFHDTDVDQAADSVEATDLVRSNDYDIVIVDLDLPRCSGITLMEEIRQIRDLPVLVLTSHDDAMVSVLALEAGADEFCVKPLAERELALRVDMAVERHRVRRSVRRAATPARDRSDGNSVVISVGELTIDPYCRIAIRGDQELDLTTKEFDLLIAMASAPGKVFTRAELLEMVWDARPEWQSIDTVTEHVYRLRQKLDEPGVGRSWIQTVRGAGYRFDRRRAEMADLDLVGGVG